MEEITDLNNSDVCTKYQEASKIVNLALMGLIEQCIVGAKILDLCKLVACSCARVDSHHLFFTITSKFGTTIIETQASKLYTKKINGKNIERGVAFPVCVSVNDVICNHSPLASEEVIDCLRSRADTHPDWAIPSMPLAHPSLYPILPPCICFLLLTSTRGKWNEFGSQ
eukprot:scaffold24523_cov46-Cyclotella_meneghiniana.AAC.2